MTWKLLQLIFPLLLFIVPTVLYKCSNRFMTRFYTAMLRSSAARKLYLQTLLIVMLLFHYIYVSGHFGEFGVLFSTILSGVLFSHKRAERWLRLLKAHRQLYFRMATFSMAMVAIPHLYTMAVTIAFFFWRQRSIRLHRCCTNGTIRRNRTHGEPTHSCLPTITFESSRNSVEICG
jgi:hypothetical protein